MLMKIRTVAVLGARSPPYPHRLEKQLPPNAMLLLCSPVAMHCGKSAKAQAVNASCNAKPPSLLQPLHQLLPHLRIHHSTNTKSWHNPTHTRQSAHTPVPSHPAQSLARGDVALSVI